ncbi:PREDICTED: aspartyl/asparaginyl beta-hydroxylase, partial [Tauraco erythrolophus]|uniref:aspartyl/asparaginyl beta-hydroxylase n=1 Tax=Tauraco erythrolophus TaxID=121530 RepID=UPI000523310C
MADDTEAKHGGSKNGKKDGLSGSSFFTWFMVIALLGVWTSVAVVWFELVDYEEVLGKLGIYDADGDGDFDVEDAKVLLGEEPGGVAKKKPKVKVKEAIKEPLKKLKEKQESKKDEIKDEEEKKKARKEKDATGRKDKKAVDVNKLKKDSDKAKRDRGKEKEKGLDKNVKSKETTKKSVSEKDGTIQEKEHRIIGEFCLEGLQEILIQTSYSKQGHLRGLKERSVPAQPTSPESEETIQPAEKSYVESEHKNADIDLEEEIRSVLHEALHSQPGERHEDVDESINDQWQVKEETHGETFEPPMTDDLLRELENEMLEAYETPDSIQKDADLLTDDLGATEAEPYEAPVSYEYDMDVEKTESDPEAPGDSELMLEDAVEHYTDDRVHDSYNEDYDEIIEDFGIDKELSESKHTEDVVATEPEES